MEEVRCVVNEARDSEGMGGVSMEGAGMVIRDSRGQESICAFLWRSSRRKKFVVIC